jgi:hypothetical protein
MTLLAITFFRFLSGWVALAPRQTSSTTASQKYTTVQVANVLE